MRFEEWIQEELKGLSEQGLERSLTRHTKAGGKFEADGKTILNFSSNDYLDFSGHPRVLEAAKAAFDKFGAGAGSSRLVTGTFPIHEDLELRLAGLKGYPASLVFASGYMTNAGTIPALVERGDEVLADRLVHASIIDAVVLSRARLRRFQHNDAEHLERLLRSAPRPRRRLVVTESVFSMDGDLAPLREIAASATKHGAMLMVDEAHATGIFGPRGSGLVGAGNLEQAVNVSMGTLSKAVGSHGGFVACSLPMRQLLVNRARAFIYTTALPPASVAAAIAALSILEAEPGLGKTLLDRAAFFRKLLRERGLETGRSESQIIPVMVGDARRAVKLSLQLAEKGIVAAAIRPPTVPSGTARIRLSVTLAHTIEDITRAAAVIKSVFDGVGPDGRRGTSLTKTP